MKNTEEKIVQLFSANDVCNNNEDISKRLHLLADKISSGDFAEVAVACLVLDTVERTEQISMGPPGTNKCYIAGLLTYALHELINN